LKLFHEVLDYKKIKDQTRSTTIYDNIKEYKLIYEISKQEVTKAAREIPRQQQKQKQQDE
jgi:hypothetical protein